MKKEQKKELKWIKLPQISQEKILGGIGSTCSFPVPYCMCFGMSVCVDVS